MKATMLLRAMTAIGLLSVTLSFTSCASTKPIYFNDSQRIFLTVDGTDKGPAVRSICDATGKTCSGLDFDGVVMSQGKYRELRDK